MEQTNKQKLLAFNYLAKLKPKKYVVKTHIGALSEEAGKVKRIYTLFEKTTDRGVIALDVTFETEFTKGDKK